jgi:8-oxo-dGTP pyrophosphatase MutT (NUDIX family)
VREHCYPAAVLEKPQIRRRLADYVPPEIRRPPKARHRASVAMILGGPDDDPHLCFIQRAEREGDRWSGQMAFPGGHADHDGESIETAAERETLEEVGLALSPAQRIGALDPVRLLRTGASTRAVLFPVAYAIGPKLPALSPDPKEVAAARWISLRHLFDPGHATTISWKMPVGHREFPGIGHEGQVIWGLTFRVLGRFAEVVGLPALPAAW